MKMKGGKRKTWGDVFKHYQKLHDDETVRGYFTSDCYAKHTPVHHGCEDPLKCAKPVSGVRGAKASGCSWWCKYRGGGMGFVPICHNWTQGYAFNIIDGTQLKKKTGGPPLGFIRLWTNTSRGRVADGVAEGGRYPSLALQFRDPSRFTQSKLWARWMASRVKMKIEGNDMPYLQHDIWSKTGGNFYLDSCCDKPEPAGEEDMKGFDRCKNCGAQTKNTDYYDPGPTRGIGEYIAPAEGGQEATKSANKQGGSDFSINQKVWESFQKIWPLVEDSCHQYFSHPIDRDIMHTLCLHHIGMRLPQPTGGEKRLAREDDAWAAWVVREGDSIAPTLHGYPHLALAALMWLSKAGGKLDNGLLSSIHTRLLHKEVPGLKKPWRERDVLFVVEILRLICFEEGQDFEWTLVP